MCASLLQTEGVRLLSFLLNIARGVDLGSLLLKELEALFEKTSLRKLLDEDVRQHLFEVNTSIKNDDAGVTLSVQHLAHIIDQLLDSQLQLLGSAVYLRRDAAGTIEDAGVVLEEEFATLKQSSPAAALSTNTTDDAAAVVGGDEDGSVVDDDDDNDDDNDDDDDSSVKGTSMSVVVVERSSSAAGAGGSAVVASSSSSSLSTVSSLVRAVTPFGLLAWLVVTLLRKQMETLPFARGAVEAAIKRSAKSLLSRLLRKDLFSQSNTAVEVESIQGRINNARVVASRAELIQLLREYGDAQNFLVPTM